MVVLPHAIVNPWTVVIHLPDAPLTDGAMVGTLGLDAAALGTLEDHLTLLETHPLDVLLGGVTAGDGALKVIVAIILTRDNFLSVNGIFSAVHLCNTRILKKSHFMGYFYEKCDLFADNLQSGGEICKLTDQKVQLAHISISFIKSEFG